MLFPNNVIICSEINPCSGSWIIIDHFQSGNLALGLLYFTSEQLGFSVRGWFVCFLRQGLAMQF